jgi:asparagine synthase (glutamine-hydrolysing)
LFNETGDIALVYNGEIYEYEEIRDELVARGHKFYTDSDSEVLIHLYEEYGTDFISQLNGEFAFALYDDRNKKLLLARDPYGVNPLCYAFYNGRFIFSSEAKGILATEQFPRQLNGDYFQSIGVGVPNTRVTLFKGIDYLPPGHYMLVENGAAVIKSYYNPEYLKCDDTYPEAQEKIRSLLATSVNRRLKGNPPLALALSSGLDSTVIAGLVQTLGYSNPAFSLSFSNRSFDEAAAAKRNAQYYELEHFSVEAKPEDLAANFRKAVWHTENTTNSLSNAGRLIMNCAISGAGYKAVMGGESSDEIFGGYPFFVLEYLWQLEEDGLADKSLISRFEEQEKLSKRIFWDNPAGRKGISSPYNSYHIPHLRAVRATKLSSLLWSADMIHSAAGTSEYLFALESPPTQMAGFNAFDKSRSMARSIAGTFVFPGLGDRLEMANSLEGRIPFLDADLVKYVNSLPVDFFIDTNTLHGKKILREAFASVLPVNFDPPPKHTFMAPAFKEIYRLKSGREMMTEYLSRDAIKKYGVLNPRNAKLIKMVWKTGVLTGSIGLFADSLIGLMLSVQLLYDDYILNHPLKNIDWKSFPMIALSTAERNELTVSS